MRNIPREHLGQLIQQALALDVDFDIYIPASETTVLFTCAVRVPQRVLGKCAEVLAQVEEPLVSWAHSEERVLPTIVNSKDQRVALEKHSFWKLMNDYLHQNGPFDPLKLFKHESQNFYSRTKGGVDGSTQYRSTWRSSMVVFKWEQKLITQKIMYIVANAFIFWKISRRSDLLQPKETLQDLEKYRGLINRGVSFGTFVLDLCPKLVRYAEKCPSKNVQPLNI